MNPAQCRAARALLDWSQQKLAEASQVGNATIRNFEGDSSAPQNATLQVLRQTLESAGVIFVPGNGDGPGVRIRKQVETVETLTNKIADLHEALPIVSEEAKRSPQKAMKQLEHARVKNEIVKAKGSGRNSRRSDAIPPWLNYVAVVALAQQPLTTRDKLSSAPD